MCTSIRCTLGKIFVTKCSSWLLHFIEILRFFHFKREYLQFDLKNRLSEAEIVNVCGDIYQRQAIPWVRVR